MAADLAIALAPLLAATEGEEGGSFLVQPDLGIMLWTLTAFGIAAWILYKKAFPRIAETLDKRAAAIADSIDVAESTKREAEEILAEYRQRLKDAREQADDIIARARKAGEVHEREALEAGRKRREELMAQARSDIEAETRRAIQEIRNEVADLTVLATEKVTRKTLSREDQERLVGEALQELDFSQLAGDDGGRG